MSESPKKRLTEVEVKLVVDGAAEARLLEGTEPLLAVRLDDVYYDDATRSLARSDRWLRTRNGTFELKQPAGGVAQASAHTTAQAYIEVTDAAELNAILDGPPPGPYQPCWRLVSTRQSYRADEYVISIDRADFGYRVAEVELQVEQGQEQQAAARLEGFLAERDLALSPTPGKLAVLIARDEPTLYDDLVRRQIFPAFTWADILDPGELR